MRRFAVVSHVLPPTWSGQAVMLQRILSGIDPDRYVLIETRTADAVDGGAGDLPARRYSLRAPTSSGRLGRRVRPAVNLAMRTAAIARILRRERCDAVVACTGDLWDLPAAAAAARLTRTAFHPYYFDWYAEQWPVRWMKRTAAALEPRLLRSAARVIVPNELLAECLYARYGVTAAVVHNPVDLDAYRGVARSYEGRAVVFTGTVYGVQADALRRLVAALPSAGAPQPRLHLFTATGDDELSALGIAGPAVVNHGLLPASATAAAQSGADVLFLPLASQSAYSQDLVRTSAPGKLGEYLAAGAPILAHVPADGFVARYLKRHECGIVVGRDGPAEFAAALDELLGNPELRARLSANARARARADFSVPDSRERFLTSLA